MKVTSLQKQHCRVKVDELSRHTNPSCLPKNSDVQLPKPKLGFGQLRAIKAMNTAFDIRTEGYHVFAIGEKGLGKRDVITELLQTRAQQEKTPDDWVYVHNFKEPRCPIAMCFDATEAQQFQTKVHDLWHQAKKKLSAKFFSDAHQTQIELIKSKLTTKQATQYQALNQEASSHHLSLVVGHDGQEKFQSSEEEVIDYQAKQELLKKLNHINLELQELENDIFEALDKLHESTALSVLKPLFLPLMTYFKSHVEATKYLSAMCDDMVRHATKIINEEEGFVGTAFGEVPSRYQVNVIVSHNQKGAPIVFETLPTYLNLLGHIEYTTELGTVYCDVSMIRAGALHQANGGYLVLDVMDLLEQPYAWQGLKHALKTNQICVSNLEKMLTLTGSLSLAPDGIPLDVKVILLGDIEQYQELLMSDVEFASLFNVRADFYEEINRDENSEFGLAVKAIDLIKKHSLPIFDASALASIIDQMSVLADNKHKLALHMGFLRQLIFESAHQAKIDKQATVMARHVKNALYDFQERRAYLKQLYLQEIATGQQMIDTKGVAVGQVNALTVVSDADYEFGLPTRLTALIIGNFGHGDILDIERDVELGGSLHAKGVLIMTSYLRSLFSEYHELNFSASLAFEQSYTQIDGDSATLAEACALLSALSQVPLAQNIAVTGSMNQLGQAQAVGGVNTKIIGFFEVCQQQGLTGTQGVIIPRANLDNLMLPLEIRQAIEQGRFHLYAVTHVTQALSILTGMLVDDKTKKGTYKKHTVFGRAVARLATWEDEEEKSKDKPSDK